MRLLSLCLALWLTACAAARFDPAGPGEDEYAAHQPLLCRVLRPVADQEAAGLRRRHPRRDRRPLGVLPERRLPRAGRRLSGAARCAPDGGVGLSMNAHFRNAKWVATPGRDFFFAGGLTDGTPVTRARYQAVQARGQAARHLRWRRVPRLGVRRHAAGLGARRLEIRDVGRDRLCGRARARPLLRAGAGGSGGHGRDGGVPQRSRTRPIAPGVPEFHWNVFRDNCIHLAHNALAEVGLWPEWPINRPSLDRGVRFPGAAQRVRQPDATNQRRHAGRSGRGLLGPGRPAVAAGARRAALAGRGAGRDPAAAAAERGLRNVGLEA